MKIRNEKQLEKALMKPLYDTVDYVLHKILVLNKEVIQKIVYDTSSSSDWYIQSGEFKKAWGKKNTMDGSHVKGSFYYSPELMKYNPTLGQHGTPDFVTASSKAGDAREYLAEIIYEGISRDIFHNDRPRKGKDAWDILIKEVGRYNMKKWIKEGMQQAGLNVKMHVFSLEPTIE